MALLGEASDGINWAMVRVAQSSIANLCVVPLQDVLGLGSEARMNIPSFRDGNWAWRYRPALCGRSWRKSWPPWPRFPTVCLHSTSSGHGEAGENFPA